MKINKTLIVLIIVAVIFLASVILISILSEKQNLVGNDKDEHGCIGSAGYTWCEKKQSCIRPWEEPCDLEAEAKTFCEKENVSKVYICGDYIRVVSSLLGGGSSFYKNSASFAPILCPLVAPDSMSEECRSLTLGNNCTEKEIC